MPDTDNAEVRIRLEVRDSPNRDNVEETTGSYVARTGDSFNSVESLDLTFVLDRKSIGCPCGIRKNVFKLSRKKNATRLFLSMLPQSSRPDRERRRRKQSRSV